MREALALGIARDQLVEKELVLKQLTWFLTAIRLRLLAFPGNLAARVREPVQSRDARRDRPGGQEAFGRTSASAGMRRT